MRTVSERWRRSVSDATRWATDIRYSNDGGTTWSDPALLYEGTVTADANQQVRWQCSLTLGGWPVGLDGIQPFTSRLRIRHGIEYAPGDRELIGMGVYRVDSINRTLADPDRITLDGGSFESYIISAPFTVPRTLGASSAAARLEKMIHEILPKATIVWHDNVDADVWLPQAAVEGSRWDVIDGNADATSIARSIGARVYCDGAGVWHVAGVPSIHDEPAWTSVQGEGGVLVESTESLTADEVYNVVVAVGESTDGTITKQAIAEDDDPGSLTYVGRTPDEGGFGRRVRKPDHVSALIRTYQQARSAAYGLLEPSLGLKQQISFDQIHDPTKEPGDVGLVDSPTGQMRVILDRCTYDLTGGSLRCSTRTTRTTLGRQLDEPDWDAA